MEFPDDVTKAAREAINSAVDDCGAFGIIAKAIISERERCAEVAEKSILCRLSSTSAGKHDHKLTFEIGAEAQRKYIAKAIRKGATT